MPLSFTSLPLLHVAMNVHECRQPVDSHDLLPVACALPPVEAVSGSTSGKDCREAAASGTRGAQGLKVEFGVSDKVCASDHDVEQMHGHWCS